MGLLMTRLVANDFGHKSQELSFVIRTFQLATFPFARIRVFCNFTSWMWMINLLVLGWGSPNHQNKWENDFLLDIFYWWFWYSQLEKLTHSHSNRVLTITITLHSTSSSSIMLTFKNWSNQLFDNFWKVCQVVGGRANQVKARVGSARAT